MKIAITGANGFLGSRIAKAALEVGHEVIALIRKGADLRRLPTHHRLHLFKISYPSNSDIISDLEKITENHDQIDLFIHNAGLTVSVQPELYHRVNTGLTNAIVASLQQYQILNSQGKFIYISSYAAHGPFGINQPVSAYGASKRAAEEDVIASQLNYCIVRPTAIYGPGDQAFLPLFKVANRGFYPMIAPTSQLLSMIHADDLANAILNCYQLNEKIVHFSDGQVYSQIDLKRAFEQAFNKKLKPINIPEKMVRGYLGISDWAYRLFTGTPDLTLEKYHEICSNWNLSDDPSLYHFPISGPKKLGPAFLDTWNYYKNNSLA